MNEQQRIIVPLLPLRGLLVFPTMVLHLDVGREKSVQALEKAMMNDHFIFLTTQKDTSIENPTEDDFFEMGTLTQVKQMLKLPNGTFRVLVEGLKRGKIEKFLRTDEYFEVRIQTYENEEVKDIEEEALMRMILDLFEQYIKMSKKVSAETFASVQDIEEPGRLADIVASYLPLKLKDKQDLLEKVNVKDRMNAIITFLNNEKEVIQLERKIGQRVKQSMERTQKEYYLREQMKAIQKELGEKEGKSSEIEKLKEKIGKAGMPDHVFEAAMKELDRYEKLPGTSAESAVIRNYLDWLIALPWTTETKDDINIKRAERILNEDHYGLEKVKERVLEYLAVQQLTNSLKGPILCLVGPPGVGKTSLARSVARSLNRKFVRVSLGGVRDESEIRGHRRTYVGAMPGRIIQGMRKAGTINPVFLLDEIDKMSNDFRGDPSSAMLEVLDPEQNKNFSDHYIEETYDLSKVMFIATANDLSTIPGPLRDRMEIISIAGYTEIEKLHIAKDYLIKKQLKEHGLQKQQLQIRDDAILSIVRYFTREAGVRGLERQIAKICRKTAKIITSGEKKRVIVTNKNIEEFLGKKIFHYGQAEKEDQVGVATGLAYTAFGGDTLQIEVSLAPGKGKLVLTGKLGDVMKESAQAAFSYVRSSAEKFGIDPMFHEKYDIHIHVPEGAVPKDGPSAGVTITTALVSALTGKPIRREVGMTGEVTLRGRVLAIGGLKEKTLSAHRAGLTTIILPKDNERDLDDIPESVREELTFIPVTHVDEVLKNAIVGEKVKIKSAEIVISAVSKAQYPENSLPEIALAGRSNVGKSSFINKMLNRKNLARTSSKPGKTQTLNFYLINEAFYFVDVPGYGYAKVSKTERAKWGNMIETYLTGRHELKSVILIVDLRHPPTNDDVLMYQFLKHYSIPVIVIATKADKIPRGKWEKHAKIVKEKLVIEKEDPVIIFSSETGVGKEEAWQVIGKWINDNESKK